MGGIAAADFSRVWQTYAAMLVALCSWFLNTLIADTYVTIFEPSGLTLWTFAVGGWCAVFAAHKICEFLLPNYARQTIFLMFVVISAFNPIFAYLNHLSGLEQIGRLAQTLATLGTAYALSLQSPDQSPSDSTPEIRALPDSPSAARSRFLKAH